jgi:hypothetical protein
MYSRPQRRPTPVKYLYILYQLAFLTPGMFPAMALTRNWYWKRGQRLSLDYYCNATYSAHPEITENTSASASHYTPVLDLREARVAVHLGELELGLRTDTLRKCGIADNVSECLSVHSLLAVS